MTASGIELMSFSRRLVHQLFPFRLVFDPELKLVEHGPMVPKVCPVAPGAEFDALFVVHRPKMAARWEVLVREAQKNSIVYLNARDTRVKMRGFFAFDSEEDRLHFLGAPWFNSLDELNASGLSLDDFPVNDPVIDYLTMGQVKTIALEDAERFGELVARQRDELERTNKKLEETLLELEEKVAAIEEQRARIRDLSTPVIEVWDGLLCLPVVGAMSTERASEMTRSLLEYSVTRKARCVILDLTGIAVMDASAANHFVRMTKALACLGARCVLSGISPGVAQTLVGLGVDMSAMTTRRSLRVACRSTCVRTPGAGSLRASVPRRDRKRGASPCTARSPG